MLTTFATFVLWVSVGIHAASTSGRTTHIPVASRDASPDIASDFFVNLKKSTTPSKSSIRLHASSNSNSQVNGTTHLLDILAREYITEIGWAGQAFNVSIDTGSSDLWLIQEGFDCVNYLGQTEDSSACAFGPAVSGTFTNGMISDQYFLIKYGDGSYLRGAMGYETIRVAGITLVNQEVALANSSYWVGDGITSGLLGLAYPLLTSAFRGDPSSGSSRQQSQAMYNPFFTNVWELNITAPVFSLALQRDSGSGFLAFGGLPPDDILQYTSNFGSTDLLILNIDGDSRANTTHSFYTIIADDYVYEGSEQSKLTRRNKFGDFAELTTNTSQFPVVVDSGTNLNYLPSDIAESVADLFSPPAQFISEYGEIYFTTCNATVPDFAVVVGGQKLSISKADMLLQDLKDETGEYCAIGIQDGSLSGVYILGEPFLNNVAAVFDIGASQMRFAQVVY